MRLGLGVPRLAWLGVELPGVLTSRGRVVGVGERGSLLGQPWLAAAARREGPIWRGALRRVARLALRPVWSLVSPSVLRWVLPPWVWV